MKEAWLVLALVALVALSGCSVVRMLGASAFTRAELGDLQFDGVAGKVISLSAPLEIGDLPSALPGEVNVGVILPVHQIGSDAPMLVFCTGDFERVAREIPEFAKVRVWGRPWGSTGLIMPTRLVSPNAED